MKLIASIVVLVLLAVIVGGWYFWKGNSNAVLLDVNSGYPEPEQTTSISDLKVVIYSDNGFYPNSATIGIGSTVTWENRSSGSMWIASAMHPAHTEYNSTSLSEHCQGTVTSEEIFDQCVAVEPGGSWSFTFNKVGEWKYHDHLMSNHYGSVTVVEVPASPETAAETH
jgi:plastocyanin